MPWYNPFSWGDGGKKKEPEPAPKPPDSDVNAFWSRSRDWFVKALQVLKSTSNWKVLQLMFRVAAYFGFAAGTVLAAIQIWGPVVTDCIKYDQHAEFQVGLVQMDDGTLYAIPSNVLAQHPEWAERALPSNAIPSNAIPLNAIPSNAIPSNAIPSNAIPSNAIPSNAIPSNAIPSNAIPSNAIPSNAIPSNAIPSNAIPSNAIPSNAIPSNAIPSNVLAAQLFENSAIPSNAIPSNYTQTIGSNLLVLSRSIFVDGAILSNAIPSSDIWEFEPIAGQYRFEPVGLQYASIVPLMGLESLLAQYAVQTSPSWLCQSEFTASLETKTCDMAELMERGLQRCRGGFHSGGIYNFKQQITGGQTSEQTSEQTAVQDPTIITPPDPCDESFTSLTTYTGDRSEPNFLMYFKLEDAQTFTGEYQLELTSTGKLLSCQIERPNRVVCYGPHPSPGFMEYALQPKDRSCSLVSGTVIVLAPQEDKPSGDSCPAGESHHSPTDWWDGGCCTDGCWCTLEGDSEPGCWNDCPGCD